ncbi:solute-binding periplasmic protein [Bordetella pertussis]|uniref:Solute-binding periplasmic protein n=3 Tax=Bordetella pertussis TaxID=520 RepID=Q7VTG8_BORPE|nr:MULTISPECIES: ABC transporter substrate-binding protein [Bordetella]ETH43014.1 ABC transporter, quaternary amine uptake transporter family, substrate-binding protein [Bordetella pertussis H939]ETH70086.1 ABC transporter, quaternary amine uptake transporter family, substrate-binding protein [Bordetella pertussis STO1-CHLA-0011]ETH88409.1 ABC transporter, quaternary amine uptake transporter family, substrate-binding protein [Bordetella pertussis STO1-CHOC-0018]ETH92043.1 ABC transporter, quate
MHAPRFVRVALAALASVAALTCAPSASACEIDRPVRFSGLNWESNLVMVGIQRFILEKGYGCKTAMEIGETLPMLAALQRGDVDVTPEVWPGQIEGAWKKALASGKVLGVGHVFTAGEGWYVPRYTVERHPDLRQAADLQRYKSTFTDPEDPAKGRIYGCPAGWACGTLNENLLKALQLEHDYNLFAPGSGAAQKAAIMSAYKRKRDIVFYYWTPTALVGALDLVKLQLPAFDQAAYTCMTDPRCAKPVPTEFKPNPVVTGLNADFARQAPALHRFFEALTVPDEAIGATLGWLENEKAEADDAALYFLRQYGDVWKKWVPADVAQRVQAAL